ncbi:MAG: DEAD/DEAH box helicase [Spirochaetia bacterium]
MKFSDLTLRNEVHQGLEEIGFTDCTDVQEQTFTHSLKGRDVLVQSQTGTGKTAAYLITIFQQLSEQGAYPGKKALVVAPTRELAVQIEQDARDIGKHVPCKVGCFYGGTGYVQQEKTIADGVDLIIGTPGRLIDFNRSGKLNFGDVGVLVIDEADRLFDMGFYQDIQQIIRKTPDKEHRLTMLFSATLSQSVRNLSWKYMNDPAEIEIEPDHLAVDKIEQSIYHVARNEKFALLLGVLEQYNPSNAIVFTNTRRAAEEISFRLKFNGYHCEFLMGDLPQQKRLKIIERVKKGETRFLVATDVAARGLHVDDLEMVVNYDIPEDAENYIHRIGRTARAGKSGRAIALACEQYVFGLENIESMLGMKIPVAEFDESLLREDQAHGKRPPRRERLGGPGDRKPAMRGGSRERGGGPRGASRGPRGTGGGPSGHGGGRRSGTPASASAERAVSKASGEGDRSSSPRPVRKRGGRSGSPHKPETAASSGSQRNDAKPQATDKKADAPSAKRSASQSDPALNERLREYERKYGESFRPVDVETGAAGGGGASSSGKRRSRGRGRGGQADTERSVESQPKTESTPVPKKTPSQPHSSKKSPIKTESAQHASVQKENSEGVLGRLRGIFRKGE